MDLAAHGLRYRTRDDVYEPHDDTFLLLEGLDVRPGERFLEIGCGVGLVAIRAALLGARVLATDTNPHAVRLARENARLNGVRIDVAVADLLSGLRVGAFDVLAFNPPYLPTTPEERLRGPFNAAFDGGGTGRLVTQRFLEEASRTAAHARFFLVVSSLQDEAHLNATAERAGFDVRVVATKQLSFETLYVWRLSWASP